MLKKLNLEKYYPNFIKIIKDWRFIYKLVTFLIFFLSILIGFIYAVFIDFWYASDSNLSSYVRLLNLNILISFWSVQTNVIAGLWFFYALLYHQKEHTNKFTNINSQINISIYITITFLIFWGIIVTNMFEDAVYDFRTRTWSDIIITVITHLITPSLTIIYLLLSLGTQKFNYKKSLIKKSLIMLLYPIIYVIFVIIRAKIFIKDRIPIDSSPYPFVDFHNPMLNINQTWNNIILIIFWVGLLVLFLVMYWAINNSIYKFKLKKQAIKKEI